MREGISIGYAREPSGIRDDEAACTAERINPRRALVLCMIFCPVTTAAVIRKSCKNPREGYNRPLPFEAMGVSRSNAKSI